VRRRKAARPGQGRRGRGRRKVRRLAGAQHGIGNGVVQVPRRSTRQGGTRRPGDSAPEREAGSSRGSPYHVISGASHHSYHSAQLMTHRRRRANRAKFSNRLEQTILLNASYEPLKIVHWQKAVTLWCQGKVEVFSV